MYTKTQNPRIRQQKMPRASGIWHWHLPGLHLVLVTISRAESAGLSTSKRTKKHAAMRDLVPERVKKVPLGLCFMNSLPEVSLCAHQDLHLPCELLVVRLVARPTVAHTGGYLSVLPS